jgi:hypothetical protein
MSFVLTQIVGPSRSTRKMSLDKTDFLPETLQPVHIKKVLCFGGNITSITKMDTISWFILDDNGVPQNITIPNSYLVSTSSTRLLSPQHRGQKCQYNSPEHVGVTCTTSKDHVKLQWYNNQLCCTITIDSNGTNVATLWTVPGYRTAANMIASAVGILPSTVCFDS